MEVLSRSTKGKEVGVVVIGEEETMKLVLFWKEQDRVSLRRQAEAGLRDVQVARVQSIRSDQNGSHKSLCHV